MGYVVDGTKMSMRRNNSVGGWMVLALASAGFVCPLAAQTPAGTPAVPQPSLGKTSTIGTSQTNTGNALPEGPGVLADQVIAVVNGDLVLESDVDEDRRFQAFQPYTNPGASFSREAAIKRLIDRTLILQQAKLQPDSAVTDEEVQTQLQSLRKEIPACKQYQCDTEAGWIKFVNDQGFTIDDLTARWKQRMQVLKFIEIRFRSGIDITPAQIKDYYDKKLLPEYAKRKVPAPKLETISDRIQEILLQQQVSSLLADWLQSLKAQGNVRVMAPGGGL